MLTATEETQVQVLTEDKSKALRQRRYRLRYEASGNANLYVACRECDAAIKPSYRRDGRVLRQCAT